WCRSIQKDIVTFPSRRAPNVRRPFHRTDNSSVTKNRRSSSVPRRGTLRFPDEHRRTKMKQVNVKILCNLIMALTAVAFMPGVASGSAASQERAIYIFSGGADGAHPNSSLITDSAGNLYGTTEEGGTSNY